MDMRINFHPTVLEFLHKLDTYEAADVYRLIEVLEERGHAISMPLSKPVGNGLHELRVHGKPAFRILYSFYKREAVLLVAMKKQKSSIDPRSIKLALVRLHRYCAT